MGRNTGAWVGVAALASLCGEASARDYNGYFISLTSQPRSERCIDVPYGQFAAGRLLELHPCRGQTNQAFVYTAAQQIRIGGLCVDAYRPGGGWSRPGDQVGLWTCQNSPNQRWIQKFTQDGWGSRFFVQGANGAEMCLDVVGGRGGDGSRLTLAPCSNAVSQKFWYTGYNQWPYWQTR